MTTLDLLWRANRVRRWHTNTELAGTDDRIDGHSARVAKIILLWHSSPSLALIKAALIHDDGEHGIGDLSAPAKAILRAFEPHAQARLSAIEEDAAAAVWGRSINLSETERRWLSFADRMDAWQWASRHGARMDRDGWPEARASLKADAEWLGIGPEVDAALGLEIAGVPV